MSSPSFIMPAPLHGICNTSFFRPTVSHRVKSAKVSSNPMPILRHIYVCAMDESEPLRQVEDPFEFDIELEEIDIEDVEFPDNIPIINSVQLVGRLGADPELRMINDDLYVCKFPLAVRNDYDPDIVDPDGTSWFDVEMWGNLAKRCARMFKKGLRVGISGSIGINAWVGRDGVERRDPVVTATFAEILQSRSEGTPSSNYGTSRAFSQDAFNSSTEDESSPSSPVDRLPF